ncbi:hypothetical protein Rsub_08783 [Raphidocelis subcapitata]|uniref:SGNH hydrolase-type esterase domain-containing protein n=1 Tax=Raphidocelis subcapitata TaxID=307507 RepID=A0A2V0P8Q1_9CHLO|nr:hypothetical protein Rsub_08783 [Raphidocelis subcapitata]|eukprot:GBF96238.1 hypothetical protein Rsub_08783 [Raphidocelis subcapitata]
MEAFDKAALVLGLAMMLAPLHHSYPRCRVGSGTPAPLTAPAAPAAAAVPAAPAVPAFPWNLTVMVFGGSTSTGGGSSAPENSWTEVFRRALEALTNSSVTIVNRARSGTGADYFAACIPRYLSGPKPDLFLLEFAINGGNVTRLVESIYRHTNAPVALVRQMSCYPASRYASGDPAARGSWPKQREEQRTAAYVYRLHEFDLVNELAPYYGSPCSPDSLPKLFETRIAPGQHLNDLGHRLLGEFVARELVRNWGAINNASRRAAAPAVPKERESCFYADEAGSSAKSIETVFASKGEDWDFVKKVPVGSDYETCWQSTVPGSRLVSVAPVNFDRATMFFEFSNTPPKLRVSCGPNAATGKNVTLAEVTVTLGMNGTMVKAVGLNGQCRGQRLTVEALDAAPDRLARVCGISMFASG